MNATVECLPFRQLLELLSEPLPERNRRFQPVSLSAYGHRLRAACGHLAAEIEAVVAEEGCCTHLLPHLLRLVKARRKHETLLLESDRKAPLRGRSRIEVATASAVEELPCPVQIYFKIPMTDWAVPAAGVRVESAATGDCPI